MITAVPSATGLASSREHVTGPAGPSTRPFPVDPTSPLFVAQATLASAVIGATAGASIGVVRTVNPFALSINMGVNCGLAGITFFGLREYLISPLLLLNPPTQAHIRRSHTLIQDTEFGQSAGLDGTAATAIASVGEMRSDRVLDSALAGAIGGGVLSGFQRGPRTILRAGITASLVTSFVQVAVNQLRITRLQLLASSTSTSPPPSVSASSTRLTGTGITASFEDPTRHLETEAEHAASFPGRLMGVLTSFLPVRKLSDEEYLASLERKKGEIAKRLAQIEREEQSIFASISEVD